MFEACALCGSNQNLDYCSWCGKYFCQRCKHRYPARVAAMSREKAGQAVDVVKDFLNFLGVR